MAEDKKHPFSVVELLKMLKKRKKKNSVEDAVRRITNPKHK